MSGVLTDHLVAGVVLGVTIIAGLAWRILAAPEPERTGARFLGGTLAFGWLVLGIGIGSMASVTPLPVDHYHAFLDPIVFIAAGLTAGGLWRLGSAASTSSPAASRTIRAATVIGVAAVVVFNLATAPPSVAPDGGWPAAQQAAVRILNVTGSQPLELRSLPAFKAPDAYGYPLIRAGAAVTGTLDTPTAWSKAAAAAGTGTGAVAGEVPAAVLGSPGAIVTVCDALFVPDCAGAAEAAAVPATVFSLADRFLAAPGRTISVYLPTRP